MLNNIIILTNFKFFIEFFLIVIGVLITITIAVLKTRKVSKFEISRPIGKSFSLIFLMTVFLILNECNFTIFATELEKNLSYNIISSEVLGTFVRIIICIFSSIFFYIIVEFLDDQKVDSEFLLIIYFAIIGLLLLCVSNDLISSYLSIELISLSSYLLASYKKDSNYSVEAGLKYFVVGSISSAFFLLGSSLIYASSGSIHFSELHHLFSKLELQTNIYVLNKNNEIETLINEIQVRNPNITKTVFDGLRAMDNEFKTGVPAWSEPAAEDLIKKMSIDSESVKDSFRSFEYVKKKVLADAEFEERMCNVFKKVYEEHFENHRKFIFEMYPKKNVNTLLEQIKYEPNWRNLAYQKFVDKIKRENSNMPNLCVEILNSIEADLVNSNIVGTPAWKKIVLERTIKKMQLEHALPPINVDTLMEIDAKLTQIMYPAPKYSNKDLENYFYQVRRSNTFIDHEKEFEKMRIANAVSQNFSHWKTQGFLKELTDKLSDPFFRNNNNNKDSSFNIFCNLYYEFQQESKKPTFVLESLNTNQEIKLKEVIESARKKNFNIPNIYLEILKTVDPEILNKLDFKEKILNIAFEKIKKENINIPDTYLELVRALNSEISRLFNWEGILETKRLDLDNITLSLSNKKLSTVLNNDSFVLIKLGILFVVFSIFIKLAAAPFHLWSLDVYEGSPTISTFFFSVMTKLSLFVFLTRFCYSAFNAFVDEWQFYSIWIAIISVLIGSLGGLKQRKLKTLLAYSSTSHMGYLLLAFSMGSFFSLKLLIIYLIIYMLSGVCIWFSILLLKLKNRKTKYSKELSDIALLKKSNPALAFSLSIIFFSIAGLPPFIGFITKIGIFLALLKENFFFFCVLAVLCSVISTFYYIRIIKTMFFENLLVGQLYYPIKTNKVWLLSFLTFLHIFLFVNPKMLFLLIHLAVEFFN